MHMIYWKTKPYMSFFEQYDPKNKINLKMEFLLA